MNKLLLTRLKIKIPKNYECKHMIDVKQRLLYSNTRKHLTASKIAQASKMSLDLFKNVINKMYLQIIYISNKYV